MMKRIIWVAVQFSLVFVMSPLFADKSKEGVEGRRSSEISFDTNWDLGRGGPVRRFGPDGDEGFGPGPGSDAMEGMGGRPGRMEMGEGMHEGWMQMGLMIRFLQLQPVMEQYRVGIGKVFMEAKAKKVQLNQKRKELSDRMIDLSGRLEKDMKLSTDILKTMKDLEEINRQIMGINRDAMEQIREINENREKHVHKVVDEWMKKAETDTEELVKFTRFLNTLPAPKKDRR